MFENVLEYVEKRGSNRFSLPGIDFTSLISFKDSLSDGINKLPPPKLYTDLFYKEVESSRFIRNYTTYSGYPALNEAVKYYEKLLGVDGFNLPDKFADNICITAGATPAIMFFFEYFSLKYPDAKVLLLGLNYYLFYESLRRFHLKGTTLTSKEKNRIAPTVDEISAHIQKEKPELVVLTLPLNPSGEIYTENELRRIISLLKEHEILFLIDKCQLDEFAGVFDYININKVILEEDYIENTIIINSISKTRSLPGARLGYIFADEKIMNYIIYLNELYYWNPPMIYITPFILDLLFRIIFVKRKTDSTINTDLITRAFRNFILTTAGAEVYLEFFKSMFQSSTIDTHISTFSHEIGSNYQTIYNNYNYTKNRLKEHLAEITELQGGYNFCIKLRKTTKKEQLEFCSRLTEAIKVFVLPESFYNDHQIDDSNEPFWIRITAAFSEQKFKELIDKLADYLDNLKKI